MCVFSYGSSIGEDNLKIAEKQMEQRSFSVYYLNLKEKNAESKLLFENEGQCSSPQAYGDTVLFEWYDTDDSYHKMIYDLTENTLKEISFDMQGGILLINSEEIYTGSSRQGCYWCYERETGKEKELVSFRSDIEEDFPTVLSDGNYLYCFASETGQFLAYDLKGNRVGEGIFPKSPAATFYIADGKIILVWKSGTVGIWKGYFECAELGNGNLQFHYFPE